MTRAGIKLSVMTCSGLVMSVDWAGIKLSVMTCSGLVMYAEWGWHQTQCDDLSRAGDLATECRRWQSVWFLERRPGKKGEKGFRKWVAQIFVIFQ